jgi:hypothetical protein
MDACTTVQEINCILFYAIHFTVYKLYQPTPRRVYPLSVSPTKTTSSLHSFPNSLCHHYFLDSARYVHCTVVLSTVFPSHLISPAFIFLSSIRSLSLCPPLSSIHSSSKPESHHLQFSKSVLFSSPLSKLYPLIYPQFSLLCPLFHLPSFPSLPSLPSTVFPTLSYLQLPSFTSLPSHPSTVFPTLPSLPFAVVRSLFATFCPRFPSSAHSQIQGFPNSAPPV